MANGVSSGAGIRINTNNVALDCNDFKIGGMGAGAITQTDGVLGVARANVTVRNCNLRGFKRGIVLIEQDLMAPTGSGHVIENNRVDASTVVGIVVQGEASVIMRNLVADTGRAPNGTIYTGISTYGSVDVIDNTVSNVSNGPTGVMPDIVGISAIANGGTIQGNRIRGLRPAGAKTYGIYATIDPVHFTPMPTVLRDNDVTLDPFSASPNSFGIHCGHAEGEVQPGGRARDNVVVGFSTAIEACGDGGGNDAAP